MNPIWKELLDNSVKFDNLSIDKIEKALIPLPHYTVLKVSGTDAEKFLQGQLTNDVKSLQDAEWQLSCACNQKGRIISVIWLMKYQSEYLAVVEASTVELLLQELKKFAMFSKVTIEKDDRFYLFGISGSVNEELKSLAALTITYGKTIPQTFLLLTAENLSSLPKDLLIVSEIAWQWMNIHNAIPEVFKTTQEKFTPHQLNLPNLGAVNFKKGCYRGQEIIARMQYLGKLKDHLIKVYIESESPLLPGTTIIDANSKVLGEVVNSISIALGKYIALAVLNTTELNGTVQLENNQQLKVLA